MADARARAAPLRVVVIQSAAGEKAIAMLAQSARTATAYCRRNGYARREFVGLYRGFHDWQACCSRIVMLKQLMDEGFDGWVLHLDMDAVIVDLDFNLYRLMPLRPCALIASPSGTTSNVWDINDGVFLLNLGSPDGREIVRRWHAAFMAIPDERLRTERWFAEVLADQRLLHHLLRDDPDLCWRALHHAPAGLLNSQSAEFVCHFLRATGSMEERTAWVTAKADATLARG